jgi:SAM-dependent methyltransferase
MPPSVPHLDNHKLEQFVGRFVQDLGAVFHAATLLVGDRVGLYQAMADSQWITPASLAERTDTDQRYVAEWLAAQAAAGYAEYDPDTRQFRLSEEQVFALTDEYNPLFFPGGFQSAAAAIKDVELITDAFRDGHGVAWGDHHPDPFVGTDRFFRPNYIANLTASWIPALDGVEPKLLAGATVADMGCGYGASTIIMATAYPASSFIGYYPHPPSIEAARKAAADAGVADRCRFDVATATDYPGRGYDLVALFDCLHDMGDPVGAAAHIRETLSDDGTCLLVEPFAEDRLEDNLTPIGRIFYAGSTMLCTPSSRAQQGGLALGAQAGESRLRDVLNAAGFSRVRRAAETPFNLVLEARR